MVIVVDKKNASRVKVHQHSTNKQMTKQKPESND